MLVIIVRLICQPQRSALLGARPKPEDLQTEDVGWRMEPELGWRRLGPELGWRRTVGPLGCLKESWGFERFRIMSQGSEWGMKYMVRGIWYIV